MKFEHTLSVILAGALLYAAPGNAAPRPVTAASSPSLAAPGPVSGVTGWSPRNARLGVTMFLGESRGFSALSAAEQARLVAHFGERLASGAESSPDLRRRFRATAAGELLRSVPERTDAAPVPATMATPMPMPPSAKVTLRAGVTPRPGPTKDRSSRKPRPVEAVEPSLPEIPETTFLPASDAVFPYETTRYPGEPVRWKLAVPGPSSTSTIHYGDPKFPAWLDRALAPEGGRGSLDWSRFPATKNRYGRVVTPRMAVGAIMLIESNGKQRVSGRTFRSGQYIGFMQMSGSYGNVADPSENLRLGVRHYWEAFRQAMSDRAKDPPEDRIVMSAILYNRGRGSKASRMTWRALVETTAPVPFRAKRYHGANDNRMGVLYGLMFKSYLGFPLTKGEGTWLRKFWSVGDLATWQDRRYSNLWNVLTYSERYRAGRTRTARKNG